jgi:hypothetical protein
MAKPIEHSSCKQAPSTRRYFTRRGRTPSFAQDPVEMCDVVGAETIHALHAERSLSVCDLRPVRSQIDRAGLDESTSGELVVIVPPVDLRLPLLAGKRRLTQSRQPDARTRTPLFNGRSSYREGLPATATCAVVPRASRTAEGRRRVGAARFIHNEAIANSLQ